MINYYKEQFKYFKGIYLKSLLFVLVIFLVFNMVSYIGIVNNPEEVVNAKKTIVEMLGGMEKLNEVKKTKPITLLHYLKNNVGLLIILLLVGFIPFYIVSFLTFSPNVILLGVVMGISKIERDSAFIDVITTIGPHGITEFISIFTTAALSFHLSHTVTRKIFSKRRKEIFIGGIFLKSLKFFLSVSIPLMVISGFIETLITPIIIHHFS